MSRGWRTWIEISEAAFIHNVQAFRRIVGNRVVLSPVVKANSYGHGLKEVAQLAKKWPVWGLSVAYDKEALELRKAGFKGKIMVLSWWNADNLLTLAKNKIEIVVNDFTTLNCVVRFNRGRRDKIKTHIKVDIGTTRIGFLPKDIKKLRLSWEKNKKELNVQSVWSHLSSSEEKSAIVTEQQIALFERIKSELPAVSTYHLACTASAIRYPASRYDLVRLGIGLYGIWPSEATRTWAKIHQPRLKLKAVMTWKTRITQIKNVLAGTKIGYSQSYVADKPMKIAIIPVGYADGLDRRASNKLEMMVAGRRVRTVGRICMNLTMLDVTPIKTPKVSDSVTIIGGQLTAETQSERMNMITYELVSRINADIPRIVV
jgi:alanine racemase